MKKTFVFLTLLLFLTACPSHAQSAATSEAQIPVVGYASKDATVQSFTMTAKNWEFDPSTITVNKGDIVDITLTSADVDHGFFIPDLNVEQKVKAGETVNFRFVASKQGTFTFHCDVYCGAGHREMEGQLIVN